MFFFLGGGGSLPTWKVISALKGLRFKGEHNLNILALSERLGRFHCVNRVVFFTILCVCFTWLEMSEGLFKKQKNKKKIFHLYSTASL